MSDTAILECPAVQDTLFGEPRVVTLDEDPSPDSPCFCICACKDSTGKVSSANVASAGAWLGR